MFIPFSSEFSTAKLELGDGLLSALAIRYGIEGVFDSILAESLTSKHMGTLVHLNQNSSQSVVIFVTEPIMSEAACQSLRLYTHGSIEKWERDEKATAEAQLIEPLKEDLARIGIQLPEDELTLLREKQQVKLLNFFTQRCISGLLDAGDLGELLSRIILGMTFDSCIAKMNHGTRPIFPLRYTSEVPLEVFLESLFPLEKRVLYKKIYGREPFVIPERLKGATLIMTSFQRLAYTPPKEHLQDLLRNGFHLGAFFMTMINQKGHDLLGALRLRRLRGETGPEQMGFLIVEIKNIVGMALGKKLNAAGDKLAPINSLGYEVDPSLYMGILFDSHGESMLVEHTVRAESQAQIDAFHEEYPNHMIIPGMSCSKVLTENALPGQFLRNFRGATIDRMEYHKDPEGVIACEPLRSLFIPCCSCSGPAETRCLYAELPKPESKDDGKSTDKSEDEAESKDAANISDEGEDKDGLGIKPEERPICKCRRAGKICHNCCNCIHNKRPAGQKESAEKPEQDKLVFGIPTRVVPGKRTVSEAELELHEPDRSAQG